MHFSSKLIEEAINEFSRLPGIGKKTALRLVLHLLRQPPEQVSHFARTIQRMREEIRYCKQCHNVADAEICNICANPSRDHGLICVVENLRDVMALENTNHYNGVYHVLGGVISPMDGVGPEDLQVASLIKRVESHTVREVIMAISPTLEGDTTIFYLSRKLAPYQVRITAISRGISVGGELEYTDELTLARALMNRQPYESFLVREE
ncbi:MAG: recombination protein RecR [Chitinophagales bacterium]|nr:MAG: recombination protein RecR [Chitinophagales bacterium]